MNEAAFFLPEVPERILPRRRVHGTRSCILAHPEAALLKHGETTYCSACGKITVETKRAIEAGASEMRRHLKELGYRE